MRVWAARSGLRCRPAQREHSLKKRILVVDDEPGFTHVLRLTLEKIGTYEVREVNHSTCTLAAAREFDPDLILLDMMMPVADGSEVAAELKADDHLRNTPVVFLTALVSREAVCGNSFGMGRRHYLPKPIKLGQLIECIERMTSVGCPSGRMS